jgi:chromosome partitioning protein
MPGNKRTATAQTILAVEGYRVEVLQEVLKGTIEGNKLHYIVIDTAPAVGALQGSALYAADFLVIPSAVDHLALEGVTQILKTLKTLKRVTPPTIRVLPTFYDEVTRESKTNLSRLREAFGQILMPPIHRAAILRECPSAGLTIFEHKSDHRAAAEYAQVVHEVLDAHG